MANEAKIVDDRRKEAKAALAAATERALCDIGAEMVTLTYRDVNNRGTPVDTGRLRNSIAWVTHTKTGGGQLGKDGAPYEEDDDKPTGRAEQYTLVIGTNVDYAEPQENKHHFLRNAVNDINNDKRAEKILKASLEAAQIQ